MWTESYNIVLWYLGCHKIMWGLIIVISSIVSYKSANVIVNCSLHRMDELNKTVVESNFFSKPFVHFFIISTVIIDRIKVGISTQVVCETKLVIGFSFPRRASALIWQLSLLCLSPLYLSQVSLTSNNRKIYKFTRMISFI